MTSRRLPVIISCMLLLAGLLSAEVLVSPTDPNINYYGRFSFATPSTPAFQWQGSTIETAFTGSSMAISLTDGDGTSLYDVEIDGTFAARITATGKTATRYPVSNSLSTTIHIVRVILRNENHWDIKTFNGFYVPDGTSLKAVVKPSRKIEFIGDSWTAGYGVESNGTGDCANLNGTTNANKSYAALVAKAFHSQNINLGYSGNGLTRNGTDPVKSVPYYYDSIFADAYWHTGSGQWNFSSWTADLVVIALGINDFKTGYLGDTNFKSTYHAFISRILGHYPNAKILCIKTNSTFSGSIGQNALVDQVVSEETGTLGHPNVGSSAFSTAASTLAACNWHPTVAGQQAIADVFIQKIMTYMNWDTAAATVLRPVPAGSIVNRKNGSLSFLPASSGKLPVSIYSLKGNLIYRTSMEVAGGTTYTVNREALVGHNRSLPRGSFVLQIRGLGVNIIEQFVR